MLTVAAAVVAAATARTESRGCHRRTDYPEPRDVWLTHLDVRLDPVGEAGVGGGPGRRVMHLSLLIVVVSRRFSEHRLCGPSAY